MAQTCTYTLLSKTPLAQPAAGTESPTSKVRVLVTGPASSVAAGMICDLSTDLTSLAYQSSDNLRSSATYEWRFVAGAASASTLGKFIAYACSTGLAVADSTDLDAESFVAVLYGR